MFTIELLQPDIVLGSTIFDLTPQTLQQHQIEGLILDVDQTLVSFKQTEVSEELKQWVAQIAKSTPIWLVSNNISHSRIGNIARGVNLPFISSAKKPSRRKLKQAAEAMDLPVERIAMVGESPFYRCFGRQPFGHVYDLGRTRGRSAGSRSFSSDSRL